jgi:hypothetical protein
MRDALSAAVRNALLDYLHAAQGELSTVAEDAPAWSSNARSRNRAVPMGAQGITKLCGKWLGVKKSHVLLHMFAHTLENAGAKVSEIDAQLDHASMVTTATYLVTLRSDEGPYSAALAAMYSAEEFVGTLIAAVAWGIWKGTSSARETHDSSWSRRARNGSSNRRTSHLLLATGVSPH